MEMEVDTGAAVSIISECYKEHLQDAPLAPAALKLHTYTSELLSLRGKCNVTIKYGSQVLGAVYVVTGAGLS